MDKGGAQIRTAAGPPSSRRQAPCLRTPLLRVRSALTRLIFEARSFPAVLGRARRASPLVRFSFLRIRRVGRGCAAPGKLRPIAYRIGRDRRGEAAPRRILFASAARWGGFNSGAGGQPRAGRFRSAPGPRRFQCTAGSSRPSRLRRGERAHAHPPPTADFGLIRNDLRLRRDKASMGPSRGWGISFFNRCEKR